MKTLIIATLTASILSVGAFAQATEVGRRAENQQDRIANGIASGSLNPGQTSRLERGESAIHHEIHADRAANGGHLTPSEWRKVNRQQNRMSGRIYRAKH